MVMPYQKQKDGSVSMPDMHRGENTDDSFDPLESAAHDLFQAVESRDVKRVAQALRAAFEICDMEPHEEYPHEGV